MTPEELGSQGAYPRGGFPDACGMTKRELLAAMAMQGLLAADPDDLSTVAEFAFDIADTMLAENAKRDSREKARAAK